MVAPPLARRLPQLSSCGPIEARRPYWRPPDFAPFRNCQVTAPLKRTMRRTFSLSISHLPQLSSCGPIEARGCCFIVRRGHTFRNCQVAAPLKRLRDLARCHVERAFRNCQVAAPLKQGGNVHVVLDGALLPQLSSCGPIEALAWGRGRRQWKPSATVKLRPH